jgi:hypothetical protein
MCQEGTLRLETSEDRVSQVRHSSADAMHLASFLRYIKPMLIRLLLFNFVASDYI